MKHLTNLVRISLVLILAAGIVISQSKSRDPLDHYNEAPSRLRGMIEKYEQDQAILNRYFSAPTSPNRTLKFRQLFGEYLSSLDGLNFGSLSHDEQVDYVLFRNYLRHELSELARGDEQLAEMAAFIPFSKTISDLEDSRRKLEFADPARTAALLDTLSKQIADTQKTFEKANTERPKRTVAYRAVRTVEGLKRTLRGWHAFYNAYDPMFTWWNESPFKAADEALTKYGAFVSEKLVGIKADDKTTIIGDPIGRAALLEELKFEMIPYSPEELLVIANKEFDWCVQEFKKASRDMGYGDDYMKAIEAVKQKYVEPGKQPELIKRLAYEAIE